MSDLWLQIKFWFKTTLIAAVVVYASLFVYNNTGPDRQVNFWYWFYRTPKTSAFVLASLSFLAGALSTLLLRTTLKTIGQFRAVRKSRAERELADMQAKAARLQTIPKSAPPAPMPPTTSVADADAL